MPGPDVTNLRRAARLAVARAAARVGSARVWELLQERGADGRALGPLPYTDAAFPELEAACAADPDDAGLLHRRAIALHARAWDRELAGHSDAAADWAAALGCWHRLTTFPAFWAALGDKLPAAGAGAAERFREGLIDQLLEVHVEFARTCLERSETRRAAAHVQVVRRAAVPPAAVGRFADRLFAALTGSVAAAKEQGRWEDAYAPVEAFLGFFPDHLPALRLFTEVAAARAGQLPYQERWDEIRSLAARSEPAAQRLARHPGLAGDPLARLALEGVGRAFGRKARDRGWGLLVQLQRHLPTPAEIAAAAEALDMALTWCGMAKGGPEAWLMADSLRGRAHLCLDEIPLVQAQVGAARDLAHRADALMAEAERLRPEDQYVKEGRAATRRALASWG